MKRSYVVVLGAQWGDEGKGKIVDLLTLSVDACVRFQGGHNAGHTIKNQGRQFILHLLPSAILHDHVECMIANGVVVSPSDLIAEINEVSQYCAVDKLVLSPACHIILPSHIALDKAREQHKNTQHIGTTRRGIGPTYEDKVARRGLRLADMKDQQLLASKLERLLDYHNFVLTQYYQCDAIDYNQSLNTLLDQAKILTPLISDVSLRLNRLRQQGAKVLFEGAQGSLLDIDHGSYPYVTSSNTTAGNVATGSGIGLHSFDYVLGVAKAYTTRVGDGPFPTQLDDSIGRHLRRVGKEFGATTGRARRCGWLDIVSLRRTIMINGINGLCITKLDVLDELSIIRVCVAYELADGRCVDIEPVMTESEFEHCKPIYEEFQGWQVPISEITDYQKLPAKAKHYLERLQNLLSIPIVIVSVNPERSGTIILEHPFS